MDRCGDAIIARRAGSEPPITGSEPMPIDLSPLAISTQPMLIFNDDAVPPSGICMYGGADSSPVALMVCPQYKNTEVATLDPPCLFRAASAYVALWRHSLIGGDPGHSVKPRLDWLQLPPGRPPMALQLQVFAWPLILQPWPSVPEGVPPGSGQPVMQVMHGAQLQSGKHPGGPGGTGAGGGPGGGHGAVAHGPNQ